MKLSVAGFISLTCLAAGLAQAQPKSTDVFEQNRKLGRGVNVLGYDPAWRENGHARFQAKHFKLLKEAGFNSVRINLLTFRQMNPTNDWVIRDSWFKTADWAVTSAQEQGLMVILDLHEFTAMGTDPAANRDKFLATWRQLANHFRSAPESVLFEILNEPNKQLTPALWNTYLSDALKVIREQNPNRTVIVGPGFYNSLEHLPELELPAQDTNLIVTIHYYQPFAFTHQGTSWTDRKDKVGIDWLGTEKDQAAIKKDFDKVTTWAKEHSRPIYLGEFGAYEKAAMDSRARYLGSVARAAEERGWSWGYWQFDNDFILYDLSKDAWVEPIKKALLQSQ